MLKTEKEGLVALMKIAMPFILLTTVYMLLVFVLEEYFGDHIYEISGQLGSVLGIAVSFFLGFRMSSAYDRWWEARKIFGELTNNTRSFVTKIYIYSGNEENFRSDRKVELKKQAEDLISLCILYIRQFKNEIHDHPKPAFNEKSAALLNKYNVNLENKITSELLVAISREIEGAFSPKANIEKGDLLQHINRFHDIQGKAERIKNTPFLMIYSAFTRIVVGSYVLLIPFLVGDIDQKNGQSHLEFIAVPIMVIISTAFLTINKLANLFGEPFSEREMAVPIDEICNTIEQNCNELKMKLG